MAAKFYEKNLPKLNQDMKRQERKVALFLGGFSGHKLAVENIGHLLSNVKVFFFQAGCTSLLKPIEMDLAHCYRPSLQMRESDIDCKQSCGMTRKGAFDRIDLLSGFALDS